jgi:hypothetical protein
MTRNRQRFLDRLLRRVGISFRSLQAPRPFMESLEPRTLMSIAPITPPILVNSDETINNIHARVATSSSTGNFVVVWATGENGEVHFRIFDHSANPLTDDMSTGGFLGSNLPGGGTNNPAVHSLNAQQFDVAMNASGNFVIAWQDSDDILVRRFTSDGEMDGDIINVSESGTDLTSETCPAIAMDNNGDFAVTWLVDDTADVNLKTMTPKSYYEYFDYDTNKVKRITTDPTADVSVQTYATSIVQARRFDSENNPDDIITVSPPATSSATTQTLTFTTNLNPGIAMDANGDFAVAWNVIGYGPQKTQGMPLSKDSYTQEVIDSNNVTKNVTLHTYMGATFYYNMGLSNVKSQVQRYNANGSAQGATFTALTKAPSTASGQIVGTDVEISMDSAGDFAVVAATQYVKSKTITHTVDSYNYTYSYYGTSAAIAMKRYNASGVAQGSEVVVASAAITPFFSSSPLDTESSAISNLTSAMDSTGNIMVAWDASAYDSDAYSMVGTGMFYRRYNSNGSAQESTPAHLTFGQNATALPGPDGELFPAVAFNTNGVIDVAWQQENDDGSGILVGLYRAALPASKVAFTLSPESGPAGQLGEVDVQVQDANGYLVTDGSSTVTLSIFAGPTGAKLLGTVSVPTVNGVAVFDALSLTRGGTYVLKAADGNLTTATSSSFDIITAPSQLAFTIQPRNGTAGQTLSTITVSVKDQNGDVVTTDDSDVELSIATGPGELDGTLLAHVTHGIATFDDLSLATAGTYTLQAADGDLATATSSKFIITAGLATNFTFTTQPISTTAGTKMTVKVSAFDIGGNPAVLDHSKITLVIDEGPDGGTITGATPVTITNGVATFTNISFPKSGTYTLNAVHNADEPVASNEFTISAGAPAKIVFGHQPSNAIAGQTLENVEVDVLDSFNNIVISNSSAVTLTVVTAPKGAQAPGGTLTHNAVEGAALFDDLSFTTAGGYALKAVMGKLNVTSGKFVISPAEMSKLVILTQPKPVVAGVAIKPAVTVALEDQFGNIDTTNTSSVTMVIHSGPENEGVFGNASANAVKGVVTFSNLVFHTAGEFTLAATQDGLDDGVSNPFVVSPAKAASLEILDQPSDVVAGHTMSTPMTVQLIDAFGNLATTDKSTVTLKVATGPGGAKLFGKFAVAAVNGVATFSGLTLQTAGAYTLAATSGKLAGDTSSTFSVSASIAAKMTFASVPGTVTAGSGFGFQVKLFDAYGNPALGDSSTVTLSLGTKPTGGALGGTITMPVSDGAAAFSGLTLSPKGKYTLKATDSPLTLITSPTINVLAALVV